MTPETVFHKLFRALFALALALLLGNAGAQRSPFFIENPDWKETEAPPPPAYDLGKLLGFEVPGGGSLSYGVDPASISISVPDGVVRYVMVATSPTGVRNVMYEGLHCATGEFKTYARELAGKWQAVSSPRWQSVFDPMPSRHALAFARLGACDSRATAGSVLEIVSKIKSRGVYRDY